MIEAAVFGELFAVVTEEDDDRIVQAACLIDGLEDRSHPLIDRLDFRVV